MPKKDTCDQSCDGALGWGAIAVAYFLGPTSLGAAWAMSSAQYCNPSPSNQSIIYDFKVPVGGTCNAASRVICPKGTSRTPYATVGPAYLSELYKGFHATSTLAEGHLLDPNAGGYIRMLNDSGIPAEWCEDGCTVVTRVYIPSGDTITAHDLCEQTVSEMGYSSLSWSLLSGKQPALFDTTFLSKAGIAAPFVFIFFNNACGDYACFRWPLAAMFAGYSLLGVIEGEEVDPLAIVGTVAAVLTFLVALRATCKPDNVEGPGLPVYHNFGGPAGAGGAPQHSPPGGPAGAVPPQPHQPPPVGPAVLAQPLLQPSQTQKPSPHKLRLIRANAAAGSNLAVKAAIVATEKVEVQDLRRHLVRYAENNVSIMTAVHLTRRTYNSYITFAEGHNFWSLDCGRMQLSNSTQKMLKLGMAEYYLLRELLNDRAVINKSDLEDRLREKMQDPKLSIDMLIATFNSRGREDGFNPPLITIGEDGCVSMESNSTAVEETRSPDSPTSTLIKVSPGELTRTAIPGQIYNPGCDNDQIIFHYRGNYNPGDPANYGFDGPNVQSHATAFNTLEAVLLTPRMGTHNVHGGGVYAARGQHGGQGGPRPRVEFVRGHGEEPCAVIYYSVLQGETLRDSNVGDSGIVFQPDDATQARQVTDSFIVMNQDNMPPVIAVGFMPNGSCVPQLTRDMPKGVKPDMEGELLMSIAKLYAEITVNGYTVTLDVNTGAEKFLVPPAEYVELINRIDLLRSNLPDDLIPPALSSDDLRRGMSYEEKRLFKHIAFTKYDSTRFEKLRSEIIIRSGRFSTKMFKKSLNTVDVAIRTFFFTMLGEYLKESIRGYSIEDKSYAQLAYDFLAEKHPSLSLDELKKTKLTGWGFTTQEIKGLSDAPVRSSESSGSLLDLEGGGGGAGTWDSSDEDESKGGDVSSNPPHWRHRF